MNEMEEIINKMDDKYPEEKINELIANFVIALRTERKGMVQTEEQFDFIIKMVH